MLSTLGHMPVRFIHLFKRLLYENDIKPLHMAPGM